MTESSSDDSRAPDSEEEAAAATDAASEAGRLAGRAVNALGMRLLRLRSVRRAIRRGVEEAAGDRPE
ncbi:MAG TPA: hypothetical protein VOB72_04540 [Candidatus Dormibacteraeota bacterium]|nr:hypothetical protein [Candidatus Dormibacteraeota bacterium]